jgi:hypothetical protein
MFTRRTTFGSLVIVGLITAASVSLEAQVGPRGQVRPIPPLPPAAQIRPGGPMGRRQMMQRGMQMRQQMRAARGLPAAVTPGDRRAVRRTLMRRQMIRNQIRNMTPEQRTQFRANRQALQTERQRVGAQVRAGTITREAARTQMQAWRQQHLPNVGVRPRRGPGGEF